MEVQVAITMEESLGQNHARNRLSATLYRCSILEVGEPGDSAGNGITTREILKLSQLCGPGSAICDAGWPTPDCPWSMSVCRSQKKYFRNFNFNFNYRELLSKSATFSLRGFGVVRGEDIEMCVERVERCVTSDNGNHDSSGEWVSFVRY